jgi:hypothetical protein
MCLGLKDKVRDSVKFSSKYEFENYLRGKYNKVFNSSLKNSKKIL